jgi:hypothetical protein
MRGVPPPPLLSRARGARRPASCRPAPRPPHLRQQLLQRLGVQPRPRGRARARAVGVEEGVVQQLLGVGVGVGVVEGGRGAIDERRRGAAAHMLLAPPQAASRCGPNSPAAFDHRPPLLPPRPPAS